MSVKLGTVSVRWRHIVDHMVIHVKVTVTVLRRVE